MTFLDCRQTLDNNIDFMTISNICSYFDEIWQF